MNTNTTDSKRPRRNITWQGQPPPAECDHQYEAITYPLGDAFKRCTKCGSLETK